MVLWPLQKMRTSIVKFVENVKRKERNILLIFFASAIFQIIILHILDGKGFIDSIYATVATLTTVGFGDVSPTSPLARILYIPTMIVGVLMLPSAAVLIYEMHQRKVMGLKDSKQKDHVVVLGNSKEIIDSIISEMERSYDICFISDTYETNPYVDRAHFIRGDPLEKSVLIKANIAQARHVIIATEDDSNTILSTALARELNPDINIIATIISEERVGTLKTVGANHIINTDSVTGRLLASAVYEPAVIDLISDVTSALEGHDFVEMELPENFRGKTVKDILIDIRTDRDATLLAIHRRGQNIINPALDMVLEENDKMIVLQ
ncbi:MAG: calcium-gated potassium channel [Methanolobus sp. T82-4]|nr:MAG: calcium-gated potassium channel [Methanolobus sp. T82-4]